MSDKKQTASAGRKPQKDNTPRIDALTTGFLKKKEAYDRQHEALVKRLESSKANIERLKTTVVQTEGKLATLTGPNIKADFIEPIARELLKLVPECDSHAATEAIGLQQAVTVSLFQKGATAEEKARGEKAKSITFVTKTEDGRLSVRNFEKADPSVKPGSVAFASGLQYASVPIPEEAHLSWLLDWLK